MNGKTVSKIFNCLLLIQILVNLIGAIGPELGFDALWYHLTEAKLFLERRSIAPIPGNLLYWSGLPRLGEMIYALALAVWDERLAKVIHWLAGVVTALVIKRQAGPAAGLLFYSLLLVGWLSTTSYVDLFLVMFLVLAWFSRRWWVKGLSLILAAATKLNGLIYGLAITLIPWGILGVLPFMLLNFKATGNSLYPFFENFGFESEWLQNGFYYWLSRPLRLFFDPAYRVGPVVLILFLASLPITDYRLLIVLAIWFLSPGTDFGRFALFPLCLMAISAGRLFERKKVSWLVVTLLLLQAGIGLAGRFYANAKYLPVISGRQTKAEFLGKNLKFHFGDWYDTDGWFSQNLKPTDKVLVYDIHNLYYLNFSFDHESWADPETRYTHILVGNNQALPEKFGQLPLLYQNSETRVKLYLNEHQ